MSRAQILQTGRLVLTSWLPGDVDDLLAVHSDSEVMRFARHGPPELGTRRRRSSTPTSPRTALASEIAIAHVAWHVTHAARVPLYAYVATENPASRRVLDKIGFEVVALEEHKGVRCELLRLRQS